MTFEQILNDGYVVAADDWMNVIIVWNGSGTFNVWSHVEGDAYRRTDIFMKFGLENAYQAKLYARKWIQNVYDEMDGYFNQEAA